MKLRLQKLFALSLATAAGVHGQDTEEVFEMAPVTVTSATRTEKLASTLPQTITVISEKLLEQQLLISNDPIRVLEYTVPSYSPSRQKMTGAGETFRGRNPLFMIDGVPQSNPLRDGGRDGYTIDPIMVERIEVVHGASAAQGLGATGGIINYVTRSAPAADGHYTWAEAGLNVYDNFDTEGLGYRGAAVTGYRSGDLGLLLGAAYEWRGMAYDGDGNLVGIDNVQGDTMNSGTWDLYGKLDYKLTDSQEISFLGNYFRMEQDLDYVVVPGDRAAGIPATSVEGETEGEPAENDVFTFSATYRHRDLGGGELTVDVFHRDFAATYGGGTFGTFRYQGELIYDQSQNESTKDGAKVTYVKAIEQAGQLEIITGLDFLQDSTKQVLVHTGRNWVPETEYRSWAPYLQFNKPLGRLTLSGGVRYEDAELKVDDYRTLESYAGPDATEGILVLGGAPSFEEWLWNLGLNLEVMEHVTLYGSYAQGFGMPDVGRVLRGITTPGTDVDSFLELAPIVTDNYELGVRYADERMRGSLNGFVSHADLGQRLSDVGGIFEVEREENRTYGVEAQAEVVVQKGTLIGGSMAYVRGEFDGDNDGDLESDLGAANIPPFKLALFWSQRWRPGLETRLQSISYFDRDAYDFDGYTLFDLLVSYELPRGTVGLGIENVLDEQYITYYGQSGTTRADRYFAGRGRNFNLRYRIEF